MPKKDVNEAILGMLSSAGTETRPARLPAVEDEKRSAVDPAPIPAPAVQDAAPSPEPISAQDQHPESEPEPEQWPEPPRPFNSTARIARGEPQAPRTLRLRAATAQALREAWLEAKHDDVLLTAQDFASELIEEMLKIRRRRGSRAAS